VRNRSLHDALRDFALEAAAALSAEVEAGAELHFDVEETGGRRAVLYNYRPLTDRFIAERWSRLRGIPSFPAAVAALGSGAASYLRHRGVPGDDAEPALRAMLERIYEDAAGFEFPEERFERVYGEVERTLYEHSSRASIAAPLRGVRIEADRVELGAGISLVRGDWADAPAEAVWPRRPADGELVEPNVLCVWEHELDAGAPLPLDDAANRLGAVQTGLRLFKAGAVSAGPMAYARIGEGAWQPFAAGAPAAPRGPEWVLHPDEADGLRDFLALVARSAHGGLTAWALGRFEMGIERGTDADALTDHLLALRALLGEDDGPTGDGVSLRVAALCADPPHRAELRRRMEAAFELERAIVAGHAPGSATGGESPAGLVHETEHHLRALLRDVLCGYLSPDLRGVADELLGGPPDEVAERRESAAPPEGGPIVVRRMGGPETPGSVPTELDERAPAEEGELEPATEEFAAIEEDEIVEQEPATGRERRRSVRSQLAWSPPAGAVAAPERPVAVAEPEREDVPQPTPAAPPQPRQETLLDFDDDPGVTPSADWDFDDPADFSAPI